MRDLINYLGSFYIFIGIIFILVPLIYLELGRPRDLIRAFLNLLIGFVLLIKHKTINESFFTIFPFGKVIFFHFSVKKSGSVNNANNGSKENPRDLNSNN